MSPNSNSAMNNEKPNRTLTNWQKSEKSLLNYQMYLDRKPDKFHLTLIDLLYISNFKGGNATINEDEQVIEEKLKAYGHILLLIKQELSVQTLAELSDLGMERLIELSDKFLALSNHSETAIDGFKSSYLSALLHAYFPNLLPILDRRLLINLGLIDVSHLSTDGQVKNIATFYPQLIRKICEVCKSSNKTIRDVDKDYFIIQLPEWAK